MENSTRLKNVVPLAKSVISNPEILKVKPSSLNFLSGYLNKFRIRNVDTYSIIHSHLPPLNHRAYKRFIDEHLLQNVHGPSHAQIAVTNACPQNCSCCYNKHRQGNVIDTETIIRIARELRQMGVVWLGLTGGEPLEQKDLAKIIESVSSDVAVKLFTTGCTLTKEKASGLRDAGLFSVSISLDHWNPEIHDTGRNYPGAFQEAVRGIEIFKSLGMDTGVSAVLSREMIETGQAERFIRFLIDLGVDEAWLSEVKPAVRSLWDENQVITEEDRLALVKLQNKYNRSGDITVNYLGHFEGKECFGCNAGHKMVYIDAFGDVSPCVFTPMKFGNVRNEPISDIFANMRNCFPSDGSCFINRNYRLFEKYADSTGMLDKAASAAMLKEVRFGPPARFSGIHYGHEKKQAAAVIR